MLKRDVVYVRFEHEKHKRLRRWKLKDLAGKLICFIYLAFCAFYITCFCAIVPDETFAAYATTSTTAFLCVLVLKPGTYVVPIYCLFLLQRSCHFHWIERLLTAFPDMTDFSFEWRFEEATQLLSKDHDWLEAAPQTFKRTFTGLLQVALGRREKEKELLVPTNLVPNSESCEPETTETSLMDSGLGLLVDEIIHEVQPLVQKLCSQHLPARQSR